MRVLIDTDVVLDYLLPRPTFLPEAKSIWQAHLGKRFEGYISAVTPVNVFYVVRRERGIDGARQVVADLLLSWSTCPVNDIVLNEALALGWSDFEDAVQHTSAAHQDVDVLVTRNLGDYRQASLAVLSPTDFLNRLSSPEA